MRIVISFDNKPTTPGRVAEAELQFDDTDPAVLSGLKLIGFSVWERRAGGGLNVTFPARSYAVNGERRSFALLRPIGDLHANDAIRAAIIDAYHDAVERAAAADALAVQS
jgi:hypothetical protein